MRWRLAATVVVVVGTGVAAAACAQALGIEDFHYASEGGESAGDVDASPSCADDAAFSSDPQNCGACGHDCLGGSCDDGGCSPVVVADGQGWPNFVTVNGGRVFWTTFGPDSVGSAILVADAGPPFDPSQLVSVTTGAYSVVSGGPYVYVDSIYGVIGTPGSRVAQIDTKSSLNVIGSVSGDNSFLPLGLAADDSGNVYWAGCFFPPAPAMGVWKIPVATAALEMLATEPEDAALSCGIGSGSIALSSNYIFFADVEGNVMRMPLGGCDGGSCSVVAVVAANGVNPALASDGTYIYWSDNQAIRREPEDASDAAVVAHAVAGFIAVDDRYVYWSETVEAGAVRYAPKDGGVGGGSLATGQLYPLGLALVDGAVYWVNEGSEIGPDKHGGDGQVMRVAKPL